MKVSENFSIQEFVPKEIYTRFGSQSIWFVDPIIIEAAQALRDEFGPMVINNHSYKYSGFRTPHCKVGGQLSQHKFGRAIDCKFKDHTPQEVYASILADPRKWMQAGITTLENINATPTWLHVDCRFTGLDHILIVDP